MKQLYGKRKYFRIYGMLQRVAIRMVDMGFTSGDPDYLLSDWVEEVETLILDAWDRDIADGSR